MAIKPNQRMVTFIGAALTSFLALLTGIKAEAGEQKVTACIEAGVAPELSRAQAIAGKIYSDISVRIIWYAESKCPDTPEPAIHIKLDDEVPLDRHPEALAFALPYEGIHIQVFVGRVRQLVGPKIAVSLLAHVMAHEIGHILQGMSRHSESGIMKAAWNPGDYEEMARKALSFSETDIRMIHSGLGARAARQARTSQFAATPAPVSTVQ
jgi:hypothetical protein